MKNHHIIPVAIVGGGPCGLLAALLLARSGVECCVLERHRSLIPHPKAMALSARTVEIFRSLGLMSGLQAGALSMDGRDLAIWSRTLVGEEWGRIPMPDEPDPDFAAHGMHCPQTVTEQVLLDALDAEPNASILFEHEVDAVEIHADSTIRLSVRRPAPALPMSIEARFVVAADGAASPVRRWLGVAAEGPGDQGHFLNIFFRAGFGKHLSKRKAVLYQILNEEGFESFVAVNGEDLWLMHHFLQPGESPSDFDHGQLCEMIRTASGIAGEPIEILGVSPWVMSPKVATTFRIGGVFLTGDAAARLSPNGGLGMNTGLQAAHNLAWKLTAVIHGAPDTLLDTYEMERRPVALESFHTADQFRSEIFETIAAGLAGDWERVRNLVGASLRLRPPALGQHYPSGAVVPDRLTPHLVGSPVPDLRVSTADDGVFPVQDWLGYAWVLLAAGTADHWVNAMKNLPPFFGDVIVRQVGGRGGAGDVDGCFLPAMGLAPGGAVLIRPDGFVAWRSQRTPDDPAAALADAARVISSGAPD